MPKQASTLARVQENAIREFMKVAHKLIENRKTDWYAKKGWIHEKETDGAVKWFWKEGNKQGHKGKKDLDGLWDRAHKPEMRNFPWHNRGRMKPLLAIPTIGI